MDEMIELNLNYLDEFNKDSEVKYSGGSTENDEGVLSTVEEVETVIEK